MGANEENDRLKEENRHLRGLLAETTKRIELLEKAVAALADHRHVNWTGVVMSPIINGSFVLGDQNQEAIKRFLKTAKRVDYRPVPADNDGKSEEARKNLMDDYHKTAVRQTEEALLKNRNQQ